MKIFTVAIILLFSLNSHSSGQKKQTPRPDLYFQHILDGLNNGQTGAIIQDHFGFVWMGTVGGLHRYDGLNFRLYTSTNEANTLAHNQITSLYEDLQSNLWIGTVDGICKYDRDKDSFVRYQTISTPPDKTNPYPNRIGPMEEDPDGRLWIASEGEGLFLFDDKKQLFVPIEYRKDSFQLFEQRISALEQIDTNTFLIGTREGGLYSLDLKSRELSKYFSSAVDNLLDGAHDIWVIEKGINEQLWIGTRSSGLFKIDNQSKSVKQYKHDPNNPHSLLNNNVYTLMLDSEDQLWIGNENGGLHLYDPIMDNFIRYVHESSNPNSLSNNSIWSLHEDNEKRLGVGTGLQGVNLYDKHYSKFKHYSHQPNSSGLSNNIIRGFHEDDLGNIWIATDGGGLNYFDRASGKFENFTNDPNNPTSLSSNAVLDFCEDPDGNLWIGMWGGGINMLADRSKMVFQQMITTTEFSENYFNLIQDHEGNIWGTNYGTGLTKYDWKEKKFFNYNYDPDTNNGLISDLVRILLEDSEGNLWIGSETNGLNVLLNGGKQGVKFETYVSDPKDSTSLASNAVYDLFEDGQNRIWIATTKGLSMFNKQDKTFTNYGMANGFPSEDFRSIEEDGKGNLWLGTAKGLVRFNPSTLDIRIFNKKDGLQGDEYSRYSVLKLRSGELLFGGTNGFNIFHPDSIVDNPYVPQVYLTQLKIFNQLVLAGQKDSPLQKELSVSNAITLTHRQNVFSIEFIALGYTRSEDNQYAFKLDGLEDNWNYVGEQRKAAYSNLEPGDYIFRVKASNNDGIWNEKDTSLLITVLPAWWQTWWANVIFSIFIIALIAVVIRTRTKYLFYQKRKLQKVVKSRTQELEDKNYRITMQAEELNTFNDALNELNDNLEKTIVERTSELIKKNKLLADYAFVNAHKLRVPVANILGIVQLFEAKRTIEEVFELIELLKGQSKALDKVLYDIKDMLENDIEVTLDNEGNSEHPPVE